ncbi:MAG TPA: Zeta toxin [Ignavibacteria bacterium]|nr:Zeta toxin [Ignavibacteria bacterium]
MNDEEIVLKAIDFAKKNKKQIANRLTDVKKFPAESHPVSVFMAGSPGAGKTESAEELIQRFSNNNSILRIDSDELRCEFEDYDGQNSLLFQGPTSIIVDKMHDIALEQKQSFIFDGTLSNLEKSVDNIKRSLSRSKNRDVFIVYVYQDPIQAWEFVKARALKDGRVVPKDAFIKQYFSARLNVNKIKEMFGNKVQVDLIIKNIDGTNLKYKENINIIDNNIKEKYSNGELNEVLE